MTTQTAQVEGARARDPGRPSVPGPLALRAPGGAGEKEYLGSLAGPAILAASLGVQLTLAAIVGARLPVRNEDTLSDWGDFLFYPERDIVLYVTGILLTLVLAGLMTWVWSRRTSSLDRPLAPGVLRRAAMVQAAVGIACLPVFLVLFFSLRPTAPGIPPAHFAAFAALALICAGAGLGGWPLKIARGRGGRAAAFAAGRAEVDRPAARLSGWDLVVPVLLGAVIYVPAWRQVAGRVFMEETLMHWDYFAMGPALSFKHGYALGSEVHSAYGVGWPVLFSAISEWVPLSYGRMIQLGSIYVALYMAGVYVLLRMLVSRPWLAAVGTGLATLPLFMWTYGLVIWRVPNVTPLRWPLDVWCLIALVAYARSQRRLWAIVAGAVAGLAVFFVIDTGFELGAAFAWFWLCAVAVSDDPRARLWDVGAAGLASVGTLLTGLAIAGRGRIAGSGFWRGWLEAPLEFGGGFGMLPAGSFPSNATMGWFALLVFLYLGVAGYWLARTLHRRAEPQDLVLGALAVYGLLVLVKFMGHSDNSIFPRLLIPAAVLTTALAGRRLDFLLAWIQSRWGDRGVGWWRPVPVAAALAVALVLASAPGSLVRERFLAHPGAASTWIRGSPPEGVCLLAEPRDLCGLPPGLAETAADFRTIVGRLRDVRSQDKTFAVIDETGSLFYLATDTAPFGRYSRPFTAAHTEELVQQVTRTLAEGAPDYVLLRLPIEQGTAEYERWSSFNVGPTTTSRYRDSWEAQIAVVHRDYRLESEIGPFQVWEKIAGSD